MIMKTTFIMSLVLAVCIGLLAGGCQNSTTSNVTANANTNMAGHDMSKMNHDMSNMSEHDMSNMNSDPGAADAPYDLQFLDSMIHHHNGAITMANMVFGKTQRSTIKAF